MSAAWAVFIVDAAGVGWRIRLPEVNVLEAVSFELNSRDQGASQKETVAATPSPRSTALRNQRITGIEEIPQAKANLIRVSFQAGLKPAAIARMFRVPQSLVNRVLAEKPKR